MVNSLIDKLINDSNNGDMKSFNQLTEEFKKEHYSLEKILEIESKIVEKNPKILHRYYDDLLKSKNIEKIDYAIDLITRSPKDDYYSQYRLAQLLVKGYRVTRDITHGLEILRNVSVNMDKYRYTYVDCILSYELVGYYTDAFRVCVSKIQDSGFRYRLSRCYKNGIGTEKNIQKAIDIILPYSKDYPLYYADLLIELEKPQLLTDAESLLNAIDDPIKISRLAKIQDVTERLDSETVLKLKEVLYHVKPWAKEYVEKMTDPNQGIKALYDILSSFYNIDSLENRKKTFKNFPKAEGKLRDHQLNLVKMYRHLLAICSKSNLTVISTGGTALGAARSESFIPWDDDMDVRMFKDDIDKLSYILMDMDVPYYINLKADGTFYEFISCESDYWIDIFPMESVIKYSNYTKYENYETHADEFIDANVCIGYQCLRSSNISTLNPYLTEKEMFPIAYLKFEDLQVPVPNNYQLFLKQAFGDWWAIPDTIAIHTSVNNLDSTPIVDEPVITLRCLKPITKIKDKSLASEWISKICRMLAIGEDFTQDFDSLKRSVETKVSAKLSGNKVLHWGHL